MFELVPIYAQVPPSAFVNFEGAQTNPIRISSDGTRLFALNTPDNRLSVFDVKTQPSSPTLVKEIPVGIEPVSVNINPYVTGNDEAWVVNQESDSVSVVSVSKGIVTDTISAKDEPSDVVFATGSGGKKLAFVSIARSNRVNVYNAVTHALVKSIPVFGEGPRALAVSKDGTKVYAAFALSGNHSTIIPPVNAPPPCGTKGQPACSPPMNPALPPPPQVALIVDASDPKWTSVIKYTMPDNDVVSIDTSSLAVAAYYTHLGTINLGLAVNPVSGGIYVANTDALNLIHFENNLNGHIVNHRITYVDPTTSATQIWDLNPGINYSILPNPTAVASAIAMPTCIVFEPTGRYLYIAAFGTDRVAKFDTTTGTVTSFVEIDPQATGSTVLPATKRGPRGLALNASANILYVLNRIYNTISIVNLSSNTVTEIPTGLFDPTPTVIRAGRGFLYDHKLSGNGTGACASCHIDAEMDLLAWDLGDPLSSMTVITQNGVTFQEHPMKGPMTTQSLRGLNNATPYHWRGDKPNFAAFNIAFSGLLGGSQLSTSDMTAYTNFINTVAYMPNPYQNLDRSLPTSMSLPDVSGTGSAVNGQNLFINTAFASILTCNGCHTANPGIGSNLKYDPNTITTPPPAPFIQPMKNTQLRDLYQKIAFNNTVGAQSILGFGFEHDGKTAGLYNLNNNMGFGIFFNNPQDDKDLEAFELTFDTGFAPTVGFSVTLTKANVRSTAIQNIWNLLQTQAQTSVGYIDLIAKGTLNGVVHGLLYQPATNNYRPDTTSLAALTQAQLNTMIHNGDTLTIMGVPPGSGLRMGIDRDLDGVLDGDAPPP
jgi:DNA-binding beta-propeller fold protein YncE